MKKVLSFLTGLAVWAITLPALAQTTPEPTSSAPFNPDLGYSQIFASLPKSRFEGADPFEFFLWVINAIVTPILAALALIGIVYAGILYITAGSNEDQTKKAQGTIKAILTGVVIYIIAFALLQILRSFIEGNPFIPVSP